MTNKLVIGAIYGPLWLVHKWYVIGWQHDSIKRFPVRRSQKKKKKKKKKRKMLLERGHLVSLCQSVGCNWLKGRRCRRRRLFFFLSSSASSSSSSQVAGTLVHWHTDQMQPLTFDRQSDGGPWLIDLTHPYTPTHTHTLRHVFFNTYTLTHLHTHTTRHHI